MCEGEIAGYARITRNGKLVYSTVPGDAIDADSAAFASQITIYKGTQTQLPDPSLEAIHGVGNTPYYRGRSYFVVRDDDETQTGGAANQYRIEVSACGGFIPNIGVGQWMLTRGATDDTDPDNFKIWPTLDPLNYPDTVTRSGSSMIPGYGAVGTGGTQFVLMGQDGEREIVTSLDPFAATGATLTGIDPYRMKYFTDKDVLVLFTSDDNNYYVSVNKGLSFTAEESPGGALEKIYDIEWSHAFSRWIAYRGGSSQAFYYSGAGTPTDWIEATSGLPYPSGAGPNSCLIAAGAITFMVGTAETTRRTLDGGTNWVTAGITPISQGDVGRCAVYTGSAILYQCYPGVIRTFDFGEHWEDDIVDLGGEVLRLEHAAGLVVATVEGGGASGRRIMVSAADGAEGSWYEANLPFTPNTADVIACGYVAPQSFLGIPIPDAPGYVTDIDGNVDGPPVPTIETCSEEWRDIVTDIANRASTLLPARLDIDNMTDAVPGFVLGNASLTGTEYVRTLCTFYFTDLPEYDAQLHAIRRGGSTVTTLSEDDMLAVEDGDDDTRSPAINAYQRVTVMYPDPVNNYVPTPQTAPRTSPDVTANNNITMECPIPFGADLMAQKADILQKIAFLQVEGGFTRAFPAQFSRYVPSDPVIFKNRRHMITKTSNDDSMVTFEAIYDRPSAYTSSVTGSSGPPPSPQTSNLKGPVVFAAFNAPSLNSSQQVPGIYAAARGILAGYPGCDLKISFDGGVTYPTVVRMLRVATMGTLVSDALIGVEPIVVSAMDSVLETVTVDQIAARANAMALITGGIAEVAQFQTVTEDSNGYFDLTDVTRGELETVEVDHFADEQFVMLDDNIYFIPIDAIYAGETLYLRPVTLGTADANNAVYTLVFDPPEFIIDGGGA